MNRYDSGTVNIDSLTIRLPAGWQGDPVYLARKFPNKYSNSQLIYKVQKV